MLQSKNLLIISGTGSKVGKTSLACNIISSFIELEIIAIKITDQFFEPKGKFREICIAPLFAIIEEIESSNMEECRRMKLAGAKRSILVQCADENIPLILPFIYELSPGSQVPVVCESAALRNYVKPGLFLMVKSDSNPWINRRAIILLKLADKLVSFNNNQFDFDISTIKFHNNGWLESAKRSNKPGFFG